MMKRWISMLAVAFFLTGCASSPERAPTTSDPRAEKNSVTGILSPPEVRVTEGEAGSLRAELFMPEDGPWILTAWSVGEAVSGSVLLPEPVEWVQWWGHDGRSFELRGPPDSEMAGRLPEVPITAVPGVVRIWIHRLLRSDRYDDAIAVFRLNTEEYPEALNPWDSLADAYLRAGKLQLAAATWEKAVELAASRGDQREHAYRDRLERVRQELANRR